MKCAVLLILLLVIGSGEREGGTEGREGEGEEGQVKEGDMEVREEKERRRVAKAGTNLGTRAKGGTGGEVKVMSRFQRERKKKRDTSLSFLFFSLSLFPTWLISLLFLLISSHLFIVILHHCPHPSLPPSLPLPAMACLWLQAASETWPRAFNH